MRIGNPCPEGKGHSLLISLPSPPSLWLKVWKGGCACDSVRGGGHGCVLCGHGYVCVCIHVLISSGNSGFCREEGKKLKIDAVNTRRYELKKRKIRDLTVDLKQSVIQIPNVNFLPTQKLDVKRS